MASCFELQPPFCVTGSNLEHMDSNFQPLGSDYKSLTCIFDTSGSIFLLSSALYAAFGLLIETDNLADNWQKLRCFKIMTFCQMSADFWGSLSMLGSFY